MFATDLDDTLFSEMDYVRSGYRAIGHELERHGVMPQQEAVEILESAEDSARGFDNLAARIWMKHPGSPFTDTWMVGVYRTHKPDIHLLPGVEEMLERIKGRGIEIGIITDGRSNTQRAKIDALGLTDFVKPENIIISSEIGADKTTETPFTTLAARNPQEKRFLYLGDNPAKDFRWPNALGWTTVEILNPGFIHVHPQEIDVPEEYRSAYIVNAISELSELFDKM